MHFSKKRRNLAQDTKKMDCPAAIHIKKIVKFPEYKVSFMSNDLMGRGFNRSSAGYMICTLS